MQAPEVLGGRYELRGVLGRGGMAEVRDGWDLRLDRPVAVKLMHPAFSVQPGDRRRFETEARAAAGLTHPHIVAVHDSGEHAGIPFIVMERLSGWTLADELSRGPLAQERVRKALGDVLSALAAAHAAGVLHRDIKPANILFTNSGEAKVADFGIAKSAGASVTMTGQIVGTMAYLSADRLMGRPATVSDDLYAVGVVGYEALAGRKPFPHESLPALTRAIVEDTPQPLAVVRPDVESRLTATIERAMARDPRWRFASAEDMRAALHVAPQQSSARPPTRVLAEPLPPASTMVVAPQPRSSRRRTLLAVAAVLAAVVLAAVLLIFDPGQQPSAPEQVGTSTSTPAPPPTPSAPYTHLRA
ncbi:serine/threonine-protein kinase, partial [Mycolicibacterium stellerae]|uniref:serine/threonine-protein kinase n=1 Tax=Mycolicibacterium stellerae TaxID=2358193 RepID=UPI001F2163A5